VNHSRAALDRLLFQGPLSLIRRAGEKRRVEVRSASSGQDGHVTRWSADVHPGMTRASLIGPVVGKNPPQAF